MDAYMDAYRQYGPPLVRKAERILRNPEDARDVVQSLFLDLLQRRETQPDFAYLYRAVTNRCLNVLRDRSCHARLLAGGDATLLEPTRIAIEDRAIGLDLLIKLAAALSDEHAELLVLRYFDDMSHDEIAEVTGKSRKTVGKHLAHVHEVVTRLSRGGAA